jgi:UDP-galactopyranose mutase
MQAQTGAFLNASKTMSCADFRSSTAALRDALPAAPQAARQSATQRGTESHVPVVLRRLPLLQHSPLLIDRPHAPELASTLLCATRQRSCEGAFMFDYLVVGAGFSGSVLAERLASAGHRVCVTDRRPHIAGNAYDYYDEHGVLIHKYGPHIFHTNSDRIYHYLSRFTAWRPYEHRVLAQVDGKLVPFPINVHTVNQLYGTNLTEQDMESFYAQRAQAIPELRTMEDAVVSKVGRDLYEKFFMNYTRKQWGLDCSELDAAIAARVPARTNSDDRYFTDKWQVMPLHGYTRMFERMLSHRNIKVLLQADYREVGKELSYRNLVYTGPIDEYFDYRFGKLPYRSLAFEFKTVDAERAQSGAVINYPNEHKYTRITEFKYLTGQEHPKSTVVYEYPRAEGDPYYPIPRAENAQLYAKYKALADKLPNVHFVGRLGTYKYYNMDQCVGQALATFDRISARGATVGAADAAE